MKVPVLVTCVVSLLLVLVSALPLPAQQAASALDGVWSVRYADGSQGSMTVGNGTITFTVPAVGELKGRVELRTDYFESILDRRSGITFIFGELKGGGIEGKLQESAPCAELKKAFTGGIVASSSTCQAAFTAVRK